MILLSTEEVEKQLASRNISLTREEIRNLANDGTLKHVRLDNNRIFIDRSVVDDYASERLAGRDADDSRPRARRVSFKSLFRSLLILKWRLNRKSRLIDKVSFLIPAMVLILVSLMLFIAPAPGGSYAFQVTARALILAVAVMYALWPFIADFRDATAGNLKFTVRGLPLLFFGVVAVALIPYILDNEYVRQREQAEGYIDTLESSVEQLQASQHQLYSDKQSLTRINGIYENFTDNLAGLLDDSSIHAPMRLSLKISCIGQQHAQSFWYTSYKPTEVREKNVSDTKSNLEEHAQIELPFSRGEFLIHRNENNAEQLIAWVNFDNSSLLAPVIEVEVGRDRLCPDYSPEPTDAASLLSVFDDIASSNLAPIDYSKRLNDILAVVDVSMASDNPEGIGDALVSSAISHMASEQNPALDILPLLEEPWMSNATHQSVNALRSAATAASADRREDIEDSIKNSALSGKQCSGQRPVNTQAWKDRLECLRNVPEALLSAEVMFNRALAEMAVAVKGPETEIVDTLRQSAEHFFDSANLLRLQEAFTPAGSRLEKLNDAYLFASMAYYLAGDTQQAVTTLNDLREGRNPLPIHVDTQVAMGALSAIIAHRGEARLPTHQASAVLLDLYESAHGIEPGSIGSRSSQLASVTSSIVSKGFEVFHPIPVETVEEAREVSSALSQSISTMLPDLVTRYPALSDPDTFGYSPPLEGGDDDRFRVRIGSRDQQLQFSRHDACDIMMEIERSLQLELNLAGPVQPIHCSMLNARG